MMTGCHSCADDLNSSDNPAIRRVLWLALLVNASMFCIEIVASRMGDTLSLQADALDFFGDAANYAISLFVLGMSVTARARAALAKAITMAVFGLWVIGAALYRAIEGSTPQPAVMGAIATLALAANVFVALMLYRYRTGDSNMRSVWLCSRNDALANITVLLAAVGVHFSGSRWPDLFVAVFIASLCLSAAISVTSQARSELRTAASQ